MWFSEEEEVDLWVGLSVEGWIEYKIGIFNWRQLVMENVFFNNEKLKEKNESKKQT